MCSSDLFPSHDTPWRKRARHTRTKINNRLYYRTTEYSRTRWTYTNGKSRLNSKRREIKCVCIQNSYLTKDTAAQKKNKEVIPPCPDERLRYVTEACGECYECRKQKQRAWVTRMTEELKQNPNAGFYTLTIDDEHF